MSHITEILNYSGKVGFKIISNLLNDVNEKLNTYDLELGVKKKVYNLMGECLENIDKHAEYPENDKHFFNTNPPGISVLLNDEYFIIETINPILNNQIEEIKSRIIQVNKLDRDGLKKLYKETILTTEISEKGGAGLGIINMAIISENKLEARFQEINEKFSTYALIMKIDKRKNRG
jgi:vacuolar-type H+-ATPase subunit E/Vma4